MACHSNSVYDFEKIIRHKEGRSGTLYYVKWKGYSKKHNTWEPQDNFLPSDIEEYMERMSRNLIKRTEKAKEKLVSKREIEKSKLKELAQQAMKRAERKFRRDKMEKPEIEYDYNSDSSN